MRVLVVALLITIAGAPAAADHKLAPEAQKHLDAALALYAKADYDHANVEFQAAYAIDPNPSLMYALAQSQRLGGHCDLALPLYDKYLATLPSEAQTTAAKSGRAMCETELAKLREQKAAEQAAADKARVERERAERERVAAPTGDPAGGTEAQPTGQTGPTEPPRRPFYRRHPVGTGLVVGGTVVLGISVGYLISSRNARKRAEEEPNRDDFLDAIETANTRRRIGLGALAAGSALVTAGILIYVLGHDEANPVVTAGTDGTTVFVRTSF